MEGLANAECEVRNGELDAHCDHTFNSLGHCASCGRAIIDLAREQALYERMRRALDLVAAERARQRALLEDGINLDDCAEPAVNDFIKLGVLAEKFGEAAQAVNNLQAFMRRPMAATPAGLKRLAWRRGQLRTGLIQVAAVAVAWAESLEGEVRPAHGEMGLATEAKGATGI